MNGRYEYHKVPVTDRHQHRGRFLFTEKNPLNEITTYQWDEKRGVLNRVTDHYNRKTTYEYDHFGRFKLTAYPDGIKTVNILQWAGTIPGKPALCWRGRLVRAPRYLQIQI